MSKVLYFLAAESALIDQRTNRATLVNIIENATLVNFPVLLPKIFLCAGLEKGEGDSSIRKFSVVGFLNGVQLFQSTSQINFFDQKGARLILELDGIPIAGPGHLKFILQESEKEISSYEVSFEKLKDDGAPKN